jgi:membrane protein YdbS with pleckstrin-like domain
LEQPLVTRPSLPGFFRKYLLAASPLLVCAFAVAVRSQLGLLYPQLPAILLDALAPLLLAIAFVLSWVLRSPEAAASTLLALALPFPLALLTEATSGDTFALMQRLASRYASLLTLSSLIASLLVIMGVEARRRSTVYEVSNTGVAIKTGIWRRQEQTIPYASIGRIVLEQSIVGKLLDYGTVMIVSSAEWGAEYYTRSFSLGAGKGGGAASAGYARTLKEVSRDPGKCFYGVRRPSEVKKAIEARLQAIQGSELEQARYLKEIRDKLAGS